MGDDWHSAAEWADMGLPGVPGSKQGFQKRAAREQWGPSRPRQDQGGGREYHVSALPEVARLELGRRAASTATVPALPAATAKPTVPALPVSTDAQLRQDYKLAILAAFDRFHSASGDALTPARHKFVGFYNARQIDVPDWCRAASPTISMSSLERWAKARDAGDAARLAGRYGNRLGTGVLDSASKDIRGYLVAVLVENPHLSMQQVRRLLVQRFGDDVELFDGTSRPMPSERRLMDVWAAWASGTDWRQANAFLVASGQANAFDAALVATGRGYQTGGVVGQTPGGVVGNGRFGIDSVTAEYAGGGKIWLAGREGVLTATATAAIGGESAIAWINRHNALPSFLANPLARAPANDRVVGAFQRGGVVGGASLAAAWSGGWGVAVPSSSAAAGAAGATVDLAPVVVAIGGVRSAVLEIGGVIRDMAARLANVEDAIDGLAAEQRALGVKILKVATR